MISTRLLHNRSLLLLLLLLAAGCNRDAQDLKTSHCNCNSNYYHFSAGGTSVSFPTAFTPNGDGRNDVFLPVAANLSATGYTMTIYSEDGTQVYTTTSPYDGWNGYINGGYATTGRYDAVFSFTTINGDVISSCTCFYALGYDANLGCLPGGQGYTFADEFDTGGAAVYNTGEQVCP